MSYLSNMLTGTMYHNNHNLWKQVVKTERKQSLRFNYANKDIVYDTDIKAEDLEKQQYLKAKKDLYGKFMDKHMQGVQ